MRLLPPLLVALATAPTAGAADRVAAVTLDGGNATVYSGSPNGLTTRTVARGADRAVLSPDARLLAYTRRIGTSVELRLRRLPNASDRLVARVAPADIALAFSNDGNRLAYSYGPRIAVASLAGAALRQVPLPASWRGSRFPYVAFTPDGRRLVVSRTTGDGRAGTLRSELAVIGLADRRGATLYRSPNAYDQQARPSSFDPRGELVAVDGAGGVRLVSTGGDGPLPFVARPANGNDFAPLVSPGGRWIAFARRPYNGVADVWIARFDGRELRRVTTTPIPPRGTPKLGTHPLAWSPDARSLLVFSHDRLAAVDVGTGELTTLRRTGVRYAVSSARWHGAAPVPARTGTIVFARESEGTGSDLYTVRADGTGLRRLTANARSHDPAWSPDGSHIAFTGGDDVRRRQLFTMDTEGTNVLQLTRLGFDFSVTTPSWLVGGPSGFRLLFGFGGDLWGVNSDGRTLTTVLQTPEEETNGSLSRTGALAFDRLGAVWVRDGAGTRRLTDGVGPQWSPGGESLLLVKHNGLHGGAIGIADADGTGFRSLAWGSTPSWSPDGTAIVYSGGDGLYVVRADGIGKPRRLTRVPRLVMDLTPSWTATTR